MNHTNLRIRPIPTTILLLLGLSCGTGTLLAGEGSARVAGMGGAGVSLAGFWSATNNQAGLGGSNSLGVGFSLERRFMLKELGTATLVLATPLKGNTFALTLRQFGSQAFRQIKAGLAMARCFGEKISVGMQLDYLSTHIATDHGRAGGVTFEAGFRVILSDDLVFAAHVNNPLAIKMSKNAGEKPEGDYSIGFQYRKGRQVLLCVEVMKEFRYKPVLRGGLEYEITPLAVVRVGYSFLPAPLHASGFSQASNLSFGYGLTVKGIRIDLCARLHHIAGWSPAVSMLYIIRDYDT